MRTLCFLLIAILSPPALAGELRLTLTGADGAAVRDAVVMVYPESGLPAGPITFPWKYQLAQRNISFEPHVLIVPKGATVSFPNFDRVRHHVYSFSKAKRFELKLYGRDQTRTVTFDKTGTVAMGCNIHDSMSGFIRVVDTPFAAKSGGDGVVAIAALPAGAATVRVWHPFLKAPANEIGFTIAIPPTGAASKTVSLAVRPPR